MHLNTFPYYHILAEMWQNFLVCGYNDHYHENLYVQMLTGTIIATNTITGGTSAVTATVNALAAPGLQTFSGDTIYLENRQPIPRSPDQSESITTVIEF